MTNKLTINILLLLLPFNYITSQVYSLPEIVSTQTNEEIIVDGFLHEPIWNKANKCTLLYEVLPANMLETDILTEVIIAHNDEYLFFGFVCHEDNMNTIKGSRTGISPSFMYDDQVIINICTYTSSFDHYILMVNPYGRQFGGFWIYTDYHNQLGYGVDLGFDWLASSQMFDSCWTLEVKVPFSGLRFPSATSNQWRLDLFRYRPRNVEYWYSWAPHPHGEFFQFSHIGHLFINQRISVTRKVEVLPYTTGELKIGPSDSLNPNGRFGISGRYYITQNHIIDFALLPDYSQIETDAPQININTNFALYLDEKRPFFTERKVLFETPIELYYTRTMNDPLAAIKFAGRFGKVWIGSIASIDQHTLWVLPFQEASQVVTSDEKSIAGITRVKYNLSSKLTWGIILTGRALYEKGFNYVFSTDGRYQLFENFACTYQAAASITQEPNDTVLYTGPDRYNFGEKTATFDGERLYGGAFLLNIIHNSKYISASALYKGISSEFRSDNGFIQHNNLEIRELNTMINLHINKSFIQTILPTFSVTEERLFFGESKKTIGKIGMTTYFKRQVILELNYLLSQEMYSDTIFSDLWSYQGQFTMSTFRNIIGGFYINYGRQIDYTSTSPNTGIMIYPSIWTEVLIGKLVFHTQFNHYLLWDDNFTEKMYEINTSVITFQYGFSKKCIIRTTVQHESISGQLLVAPLFAFEPTSQITFYLGCNTWFRDINFNQTHLKFDHENSSIFLKFQYRFRY